MATYGHLKRREHTGSSQTEEAPSRSAFLLKFLRHFLAYWASLLLVGIALVGYAFWLGSGQKLVANILGGIVALALFVGGTVLSSVVKKNAVRSGCYWELPDRPSKEAPLLSYVLEFLHGDAHSSGVDAVDGDGTLDAFDIDVDV